MNVAILTDTHAGARNNSQVFIDIQRKFYENCFFPELEKRGIKEILHLGDFFESRKAINLLAMHETKKMFLDRLDPYNMTIILGNHDTHHKTSNEINSLELFLSNHCNIITEPTELEFDGKKIGMVPWMCAENEKDVLTFLKTTKAQIVCGHWDVIGFEMYRGLVNNDHGLSSDVFKKFKLVLSGHYHRKSNIGNIHYLGSPFQLTWADYEDLRGFHILDTKTLKLEFIENPYTTFQKVFYDDVKYESDKILQQDFSIVSDKIVKVIVKKKTDNFIFERFLGLIHNANPVDVSVLDDVFDVDLEYEADETDVGKDTLTLITEYIEAASKINSNISEFKQELINLARSLYLEAVEINQTVNA